MDRNGFRGAPRGGRGKGGDRGGSRGGGRGGGNHGRGGFHNGGGNGYREEQKVSSSEVWQMPSLPTTPPVIQPLAPPRSASMLPKLANEICLQKPKAPGVISFANIECFTNYYELHVGQKHEAAHSYSVKIEKKMDAQENSSAVAVKPRKENNRHIFGMLPRIEVDDQLLAYDGQQKAWGLKRIPNDSLTSIVGDKREKWQLTLSYEKSVPYTGVKAGQAFGQSNDLEEVLSAFSIMMNHVPSIACTAVGKGLYDVDNVPKIPISGGLELVPGYKTRIVPGANKLYLNVNYAIAAFIQSKYLIELLSDLLHQGQIPPRPLHPKLVAELKKMILRCKAQTSHLRKQKEFTIVGVTEKPATEVSFIDKDDREITVADYFRKAYKPLKYPYLPCVQDGVKKPRYYPLEVIKITTGNPYRGEQSKQLVSDIIKIAAIPPRSRLDKIRATVSKIREQAELGTEFDLRVGNELQVPARILPPPKLSAKRPVQVTPGVIDFRSNAFYVGSVISKWTIIITDERVDENDVKRFADVFMKQGRNSGVNLQAPMLTAGNRFYSVSDRKAMRDVERSIESFVKQNHLEFVLFVISDQSPIHASIKFACDIKLGVASKCVKTATIKKVCFNDRPGPDQCIVNILYGLNPKFNGENVVGINTEFASNFLRTSATLIIGIDVNHGQAKVRNGMPKMPSTVGIVGTRNMNATLYTALMRAQCKPPTSADREIVQEEILRSALDSLFRGFYLTTKRKPERVIVYRDGVSNGQFNAVLDVEMRTIIKVCDALPGDNYRPPITFITVQKGHDTRLFPKKVTLDNRNREKQNPIAGTVVDTVMTNSKVWNFFLASHEGIQGTSKPAHYSVLYDENGFSNDQLQSLSYYLCHLYGKCPRAVSLPSPIYYAHYVAFRAAELGTHCFFQSPNSEKFFTRPQLTGPAGIQQLEEEEKVILQCYNEAIKVTPDFAKSMYFL